MDVASFMWMIWMDEQTYCMFSFLPCQLFVHTVSRFQWAHLTRQVQPLYLIWVMLQSPYHYLNICFMFISQRYISMHTHVNIHMCAQSRRVEKVLHWFSADCCAEQRNRRESRKKEGSEREQAEIRQSVALTVLNRGEWAEPRGGCVVSWGPLLVETHFPSGRSHVRLWQRHSIPKYLPWHGRQRQQ